MPPPHVSIPAPPRPFASSSSIVPASLGIGSRKLERTPLQRRRPEWVQRCQTKRIACVKDVLSRTEMELMEELDLHGFEVRELVALVSDCIAPPRRAFALLQEEYGLVPATDAAGEEESASAAGAASAAASSSAVAAAAAPSDAEQSRALFLAIASSRSVLSLARDVDALRINKGITELVGPAGAGKTQACFTLCVEVFLSVEQGGLAGGTLYIDTEGVFSGDRLVEIAQLKYKDYFTTRESLIQLVDSVHVVKPTSVQELKDMLPHAETLMLEKGSKLLILDSIAFLARQQMNLRTELLGEVSSALKSLSSHLNVACVVTNQVTTKFVKGSRDSTAVARAGAENEAELVAALGVAWAHAVNTRFLLQTDGAMHRFITVAKSPMYPGVRFHFVLSSAGFQLAPRPDPTQLQQPHQQQGGDSGGGSAMDVDMASGSVLNMAMRSTHRMSVGTRR